ncbi:MAG: hypothetical protein KTR31_23345 [Myxococcales bacterium]|nr:hypothetical protein [Myxococcales bacterium]
MGTDRGVGVAALAVLLVACFDPFPREPEVSLERSACNYFSNCDLPAFMLLFDDQETCEEQLRDSALLVQCAEFDQVQEEQCRQQIELMTGSCGDITSDACEAVLGCDIGAVCEEGYDRLVECGFLSGPFPPEFCLGFDPLCDLNCLVSVEGECDSLVADWFTCSDRCRGKQ